MLITLMTEIQKVCYGFAVYNTVWVPLIDRVVYYRPMLKNKYDYIQIWTGGNNLLLNTSLGRKGRTTQIFTYNFLLQFTYEFVKCGTTLRSFLASHNQLFKSQYGATETELSLLSFNNFKEGVFFFWENVLDINMKSSFVCQSCGPRPKDLCMDGVAIRILFEKIQDSDESIFSFPLILLKYWMLQVTRKDYSSKPLK